jgi:hypothetical protein
MANQTATSKSAKLGKNMAVVDPEQALVLALGHVRMGNRLDEKLEKHLLTWASKHVRRLYGQGVADALLAESKRKKPKLTRDKKLLKDHYREVSKILNTSPSTLERIRSPSKRGKSEGA